MRIYKRGNYWYIDYTFQGTRIRKKVSRSKRMAELALKDIEVKIAKEQWLGVLPKNKISFEEFSKQYLRYSEANKSPKYSRTEKRTLESKFIPIFKDKYLDEITAHEIEEYKYKRQREVKAASVNRELACLKHLYNKAIDWDLVQQNPVKKVKLLKEPPGRMRYLTIIEINKLLDNCAEHLKP